ncbi:MAG: SUMF1/EgtB/PvdO family nonheme iron enzyme [Candidatus Accumulibacter sp.]|uniref:SUMF1/EgtB/PvdO family nonheme iron enzyme n=1 Tax=Candidatus Accumulibacter proximus TaxID=2954385 RepID=A0A935UFR8_9PROT|nr:SUMF1/EgtB/PvdO family nonheme iron enzyme [Candidatus Accumulibacter proximus]
MDDILPRATRTKKDFFVSYNQADKDWAEWIAWQLEDAGYSTIIQAWDFQAGGNFVLEMDHAARTTWRTIAVVSDNYLAAQFTQPEWAVALVQDPTGACATLLPVRVGECQPEGLLRAIAYIDLVGCDEAGAKQTLLAHLRSERLKPSLPPRFPGQASGQRAAAPGFPARPAATGPFPARPAATPSASPLQAFRAALLGEQSVPAVDERTLQEILRHSPRTLDEYRLARIAEWSQPQYALDKRFTRLTLLLDQGPEAQGTRWQAQQQSFDDLREVLAEAGEPAAVLLGPPGCGKSTLLRRLELDLAVDALRAPAGETTRLSFLVPLNRYRPARPGEAPPLPRDWLAQEWSRRYPQLPPFGELLASGRLVLLLDAVNELPHSDDTDYRERIGLWRDFVGELPAGTRVLFSCRSLDYSASLSTPEAPVPHVRIEQLGDSQVEEFLAVYDAEHGPALWQQLRGTPQLDLFRSPFYLKLLLGQAGAGGPALEGRAALFTGFVRQAVQREITAGNPLFCPGALLDKRDHERLAQRAWRNATDLPERGTLLPALSRFAYDLQARRAPGEASRLRVPWDDAVELLGGERGKQHGDDLLHAGVSLQVLDEQWDDVFYVHQLLQEYFAARSLAGKPQPELVVSAWRADEISPGLPAVLAGLADSDPLPAAPATGWEETFVLAAAMARGPEAFVSTLVDVNLPLAGRCAAQPDVAATISDALRKRLQQALVARSRDPEADLRARIAAARALGALGDPRFEPGRGPDGDFLLPPLLTIEPGRYWIGSDEELYAGKLPAHEVDVVTFHIARFPVSNAEWRLFVEAGGHEDERWWQDDAGQRWRRGEGTAEGPKQQWRANWQTLRDNPQRIGELLRDGRITSKLAEDWEQIRRMSEDEFETLLEARYPAGRQSEPSYWNDPAYNDASQPVVGVCWYEARAYCAWLSAQTGQLWRLPSEAEWEAAARGREGRRYAWGDDFDASRCNSFESHVRGTTSIGVFPAGDTPQGLADLSGNVWEWTTTAYESYPYAADSRRESPDRADARRVVRGGSWFFPRDGARCAYRLDLDPGARDGDLGLRLVCVSHIEQAFKKPGPRGPGRKCPSTTVGWPRRTRCGWRGLVPSARIAPRGARRRAPKEEMRRLGVRPEAPRPPSACALLQPAAEQAADLGDDGADVLVLAGVEPAPVPRQAQVQAQVVERRIGAAQRVEPWRAALALRLEQRFLQIFRATTCSLPAARADCRSAI